jgi:hypothetical protein
MSKDKKQEIATLPKLEELYKADLMLPESNQLNVLLNQPPPASWIKTHPFARGVKYIPIERIEYLLTKVFVKWHVEIKSVQLIGNSVVTTVTLHYLDPITGEWLRNDGVGGAPLQTEKGAGAIDFNQLKDNAVMLASPSSESYAIKDAAEKIGKLFGKDLNRADEVGYDSLIGKFDNPPMESLADYKKAVLKALKSYQGEDKEDLQTMCKDKEEANEMDIEFCKSMLEQIRNGNS